MNGMDILRQSRRQRRSKEIDFSDAQHREGVLAWYGGELYARQHFPLLYEAYAKSVEAPLRARPIGEPTDFADGVAIGGVTWKREGNHLRISALTSLLSTAYFIDEHIEVRTAAGEIVGGFAQSTEGTCHSELVFETDFDPSCFSSDVLEIDYASNWVSVTDGLLRGMLTSKDMSAEVYLTTAVKQVHVLGPVKKSPGGSAPVNICYNRHPVEPEDVDYVYQESFNPLTGKQRLYAPLSAWVEFDEKGQEQDKFSQIDITTFHLKMDCQNGIARYDTTGREKLVEHHFLSCPDQDPAHPNGFSFSLDPDWKDDVPSRRLPERDRVDMLFEVEFMYKSGKRGTIELSTVVEEPGGNVGKVDWLNLLWGCIAEGSRVRMADGSDRLIECVRSGDMVLSDAAGRCARVENVLAGNEDRPMVTFSTTSGNQLVCTRDHPIVTSEGLLPAMQVHGDCRLYGPDGDELAMNGIWDVPGGNVYNLVLEPCDGDGGTKGTTFFAEGILVGDNAMQAMLDWREERSSVDPNPFAAECALKRDLWAEESR